ncbi:hypothetical protein Unana1_06996 [Umbelopsis nana]
MKRSFSDREDGESQNEDASSSFDSSLSQNAVSILQNISASNVEFGIPQYTWEGKLRELELDQAKTRVQVLLWASRNLHSMDVREKTTLIQLLLQVLTKETDNDTKCMVIILITRLITLPTQSSRILLEEFYKQLRESKSTKVKHQLYRGITKLLLVRELDWKRSSDIAALLVNLTNFAVSELADTHHLVRAASIELLSVLSSVLFQVNDHKRKQDMEAQRNSDPRSSQDGQSKSPQTEPTPTNAANALNRIEIQRIVSNYVVDSDQRVRKSALGALVHMRLCGCPLDISLYKHGVRALKDDFEDVRMGGLNLIWALGCLYPEYRMRLAHEGIDEEVRLLDDAFVKICDMVNDVDVNVRTKACTIMASYQHVDPNVLSQTFSKQIMSHNKRNARKNKGGGQQVAQRQSGKMIPVAEGDFDVESEEFRILDSGACGAFVHGLEDEYKEVRNASIDSICELCMHNDQFTTKAVDFLVDMFNDEIDEVRLNAIHSLRKIGTRTRLVMHPDQLEIVIGALEDADTASRNGTHDLLRVVRLSTRSSLSVLLDSLRANMDRYSEDQLSIYRCLRDIGRTHADYIEKMVPDLLKYDKKYLPREANADDPNYIGYIILIVNACHVDLSIVQQLPKYCFSHFVYLQSRFPDCFPALKDIFACAPQDLGRQSQDILNATTEVKDLNTSEDVNQYLYGTLDMIRTMLSQYQEGMERNGDEHATDLISRNLKYAAGLSPLISGKAEFADMYVACFKRIQKYNTNDTLALESTSSLKHASEILRISYQMEHTFLGLSGQSRRAAIYFRVFANMLWLFGIMKSISTDHSTNITNMLVSIIERIDVIQRKLEQDNFRMIDLVDLRNNLYKGCNYPSTAKFSALYSFVDSFVPLGLDLKNPLKRTVAHILVPAPNNDKAIKFSAHLPLVIHIQAKLDFVDYINTIAVLIILPDKSTRLFWPSHHNFKPTTPYSYVLDTNIELDLSLWTDIGMLQIQIVKSFEQDLPGIDDYILRYPICSMSPQDYDGASSSSSTLCICDPVDYYVNPTKQP